MTAVPPVGIHQFFKEPTAVASVSTVRSDRRGITSHATPPRTSASYRRFFPAARSFAQRAFCAAEIAARAFADIVRRFGCKVTALTFGRPVPRFCAGRPRRTARAAWWPRSFSSLLAVSRIPSSVLAICSRCPSHPLALASAVHQAVCQVPRRSPQSCCQ